MAGVLSFGVKITTTTIVLIRASVSIKLLPVHMKHQLFQLQMRNVVVIVLTIEENKQRHVVELCASAGILKHLLNILIQQPDYPLMVWMKIIAGIPIIRKWLQKYGVIQQILQIYRNIVIQLYIIHTTFIELIRQCK